MLMEPPNKAVVYIPNYLSHKVVTHGLVLPEGYEVVVEALWFDHRHQSIGIIVQGPDIPRTTPGAELPSLLVEDLGSHIAVRKWQ